MPLLNQKTQNPIESFTGKIICGDALKILKTFPDESIDCVVTSPPYFHLRDFGVKGQIGLEKTVEEYIFRLAAIFDEIRRVLKPEGTCWVNLGDTYGNGGVTTYAKRSRKEDLLPDTKTGSAIKTANFSQRKTKCLLQVPSRFALAMTERGWILRNEIIWHKPNAIPSSITDRFTVDFDKIFFFVKQKNYYFRQQFEPLQYPPKLSDFVPNRTSKHSRRDKYISVMNAKSAAKTIEKIIRKGRNKRCVWTIPTSQFTGQHFAVYPSKLVEMPMKAGCPENGIVLDPFLGSGTTAIVAQKLGRQFIGIELNNEYVRIAKNRIKYLNSTSH